MADVTLSYKGSDILELSDSGSATLKTGGKYCEDDIAVEYVKPSGGGSFVETTGEFTVVGSSETSVTVNHGLGKIPFLVVVYPKSFSNTSSKNVIGGISVSINPTLASLAEYHPSAISGTYLAKYGWYTSETYPTGNNEALMNTGNYIKSFSSTTFDLAGSANYPLLATTYVWKAFAVGD